MPDPSIEPVLQVSAHVTVAGGVARLLMARHAGGAAGHIRGTVAVLIL